MANDEKTVTTPADKVATRNGKCISLRCKDACELYVYHKHMNGFDQCMCGHTRWAHEVKHVA